MEKMTIDTIAERTFVLNLTIGSIKGRNPKVRREVVEKMAKALEVGEPETVEEMSDAADEIRVTKELLRVEEVDALVKALANCRAIIRNGAVKLDPPKRMADGTERPGISTRRFLKNGLYVYSVAKVDWVERQIAEAKGQVAELLDVLDSRWDAILAAEERRLKPRGLWDPRDYPTLAAIRACATIDHSWLNFDVPSALARVNRAIFEQEKAKAREMWTGLTERVRLSYAATLEGMVEKIRAALVPGEDGKKRVLRQDALDSLRDFLKDFTFDDVTDYAELRALVERAESALNGVDAEVLRTEDRASTRVAKAMTEIGEAVKALALTQGRRVQLRD